ncbi:bifunctional diguanylate cyclase/phosphodiesterase [cf. Phormidesmis sp. LEGE 11477]|uniref:putative bifunctional diguanylate cyclase/phosphodiesterase n=1 Tax=cf. Phormidesmis sp. LEGE 11477 TaxID=1828680 RepID=UPI00187E383C|nr:bifunctional diguanylate cyclase/phosphodiesterase [cf. Phormidesmis sp. LEGE 11477]MBE9059569.1 bifunctional diguanylate cyclase/phosphodiesterase [cf. Phormidesmis sp. LEGE 11477]
MAGPLSSSIHRVASHRFSFKCDLLFSYACQTQTVFETVQGDATPVYNLFTQVWQVNTWVLSYPAVSIGVVTGSFSVMLALLCLRIHALTSLLKRKDQRIHTISSIDSLTGLINRTTLFTIGARLLDAQPQAEVALLSLKLSRFKSINDAFGHQVADELIRQAADRLQRCLGSQDVLARTGDNQFSLLLSPGDKARSYQMAERVLASVHQPFRTQSQTVHVHGQLGIAFAQAAWASQYQVGSFDQKKTEFSDLLLQSNIAMAQVHEAAPSSGYRYAVFCPKMKSAIATKVSLQQLISVAIEQQQLRAHYQPIVDTKTGKTVGFEALVRWQHPERGLMRPDDFLPIAEELGLTFKIDRWMLKTVCQQLMTWQAEGLLPSISVNLSGSHLCRADLVEYVQDLLACYPVDPGQLSVEVTEGVIIANVDQAVKTLQQLRSMGIGVSLDDFGTGYSSLTYLQQFPVDVLKIDRSFVWRLGQSAKNCSRNYDHLVAASSRQDELIVTSILSLASALDIRVVVEGVERLDQWQFLQNTCCCYAQGNYFSRAIEAERAQVLLQQAQ